MTDPMFDRRLSDPILGQPGTFRIDTQDGVIHHLREGAYSDANGKHFVPISKAYPFQGWLVGDEGELDLISSYGSSGQSVRTSLITAITKVPEQQRDCCRFD